MRKRMKTIAAILTLTLLTTTLAGCGDQGGQNSSEPADSGQSSGESQTSEESSSSDEAQPSDQGGTAQSTETHKLTILGPDPGNQYIKYEEREEYEVWQALQDMLAENGLELEIEAVPQDQYTVMIQTRMASTSLPDIVNVSPIDDASLVAMGKQGTIQELSALIKQYSNGNIERMYKEKYDTGYPLIQTSDGEIYWLTNLHKGNTYEGKEVVQGLGIQIRKDWLDQANLEMPQTLEDFTNAIRTFRESDINGNGQQDEIILVDCQTFANGLAQVFGLGNGIVALDTANGKIVSPWYQDHIKDYFSYVNQLIQEGLIDSATIGSGDLQTQRLAENMVGAWYAYDGATYLDSYVTNGAEGVDYEPVFTLTNAAEGCVPWKEVETSQLVWDRYCITKACTDMEGVVKFLDMIYSDEYSDILTWGIEGKDYEVRDGMKVSLINSMTNEEKGAAKRSSGSPLWGGLLPRVQTSVDYPTKEAWEEQQRTENKSELKIQALEKGVDYKEWCPLMLDNFLAMATDEENETINRIQTGIQTYSDELCMKLALGTASLDDFDSYIEELKTLGLDELIAVQQARYDRFIQSQN